MTEQALDDLLRKVMLDAARQEYGDLIDEQPEHDFSPAFEKKMKKLIRRAKHPVWHNFVHVAVCILLAVLLTSCAVLAVSPEAREAFVSWVREIYEDQYLYHLHPEFDRNIPMDELALPEFVYRPTRIPEDYQIIREMVDSETSVIVYQNDSRDRIMLQRVHGGTLQITRDGSEIYTQVFINGKTADLYLDQDEGDLNVLIWEDGEMVCILSADFDEAQMIKIAESVEPQRLPELHQPAWLPDGYHGWLVDALEDGSKEIRYIAEHRNSIEWHYAPISVGVELFAEWEAGAQAVHVNGSPAELYLDVDEEGNNELVWKDEEKGLLFWVSAPVTKEELIKMAESMDESARHKNKEVVP